MKGLYGAAALLTMVGCGGWHNGRTVASWVEQYVEETPNTPNGMQTLRVIVGEIGPSAVPAIIDRMMETAPESNSRKHLRFATLAILDAERARITHEGGKTIVERRNTDFGRSEWRPGVAAIGKLLSSDDQDLQLWGAFWAERFGPAAAQHTAVLTKLQSSSNPEVSKAAKEAATAVGVASSGGRP